MEGAEIVVLGKLGDTGKCVVLEAKVQEVLGVQECL